MATDAVKRKQGDGREFSWKAVSRFSEKTAHCLKKRATDAKEKTGITGNNKLFVY